MLRLHVCVRDAIRVKVFVNVGCQSQGFTLPVSVIIVGYAASLITHYNLAHVHVVIILTLLKTVRESAHHFRAVDATFGTVMMCALEVTTGAKVIFGIRCLER